MQKQGGREAQSRAAASNCRQGPAGSRQAAHRRGGAARSAAGGRRASPDMNSCLSYLPKSCGRSPQAAGSSPWAPRIRPGIRLQPAGRCLLAGDYAHGHQRHWSSTKVYWPAV